MIITSLICSSCGAALEPKGNPTKIRCPYCDTVNIVSNSSGERSIFEGQNIVGGTRFELTDSRLHKLIFDILGMPETPPLDVYTNTEVEAVNKLMIPAYWFTNVSGLGTAQYEKGMDREYSEIVGSGDSMRSVQKHRTEWFPMSMSVNDTCNFVMAGNREYEGIITALYGMNMRPEIVDIDSSGVNDAASIKDFDLADSDIFNRLVKPAMDGHLREKAIQTLGHDNIRNLSMIGAGVMNGDVRKILLAVYEIIIEYSGKNYKFYLSNDGAKSAIDILPEDQNRLAYVNQLKNRINEIKSRNGKALKTIGVILIIFGVLTLAAFIGILLCIGGGVCFYFGYKQDKVNEVAINDIQTKINHFYAEGEAAKRSFAYDKVALKGVLSRVSGDASAFN